MAAHTMFRGDTKIFDGTALTAAGAAQNLTGCKLWFYAKKNKGDSDVDAVIALSSATSAVTIAAGAGGTFTVTIPSSATLALAAKTVLYYDVQLKDATGNVYTVNTGTLTVDLDITISTV